MENATISRRYDIKMKNIGCTRIILLEKSIIARCAVESWCEDEGKRCKIIDSPVWRKYYIE